MTKTTEQQGTVRMSVLKLVNSQSFSWTHTEQESNGGALSSKPSMTLSSQSPVAQTTLTQASNWRVKKKKHKGLNWTGEHGPGSSTQGTSGKTDV